VTCCWTGRTGLLSRLIVGDQFVCARQVFYVGPMDHAVCWVKSSHIESILCCGNAVNGMTDRRIVCGHVAGICCLLGSH
jgi:hypothetical protein